MIQGIAVFGLNGSGKSTLTHSLAKETGYFEMDVEDYYFPEQRRSRREALEHSNTIYREALEKLPFSEPKSKEEVQAALIEDMKVHPCFILAGVTMNWSDEILSRIKLAFWVQTPVEERLKRIQAREEERFGARVLAGGDMFLQQQEFREIVKNKDLSLVEKSAEKLNCPIIILDGTLEIAKNLEKMQKALKKEGKENSGL